MIGLGRMGANMTQRLLNGGHSVVVYDRDAQAMGASASGGATAADSVADLVEPPGAAPRGVGDAAGRRRYRRRDWRVGRPAQHRRRRNRRMRGNANYKDTMRRGEMLAHAGIHLLDAGTSGGVWGLVEGYSLMVGGDAATFARLEPIFQTLAPARTKVTATSGPPVPDTSPRWCTTAWSTR